MRLVIAAVERVIRLWALRGGQLGELELCEQNRAKRKKEGAAWTLADNAWASSTFFFFFLFFKHHIYRESIAWRHPALIRFIADRSTFDYQTVNLIMKKKK